MVMPCSRSASSPSTSSAKSMSSPVVPSLLRILLQRRQMILEQQLGIVEQPADQRGLAVVDAAAGEEAQQRLLLLRGEERLEVAMAAFIRNSPRCFFFSIDGFSSLSISAALALGGARGEHLGDDAFQRVGVGFDRAGQRIAAERAEAHQPLLGRLAGLELHALVVDHDQRAVALHHRAASWRNRAARSGCSPPGCIARCRARSSSTAERRGCDSPLLMRVL